MPNTQSDVVIKINNNNSNEGSVVCVFPKANVSRIVPEINKTVSRVNLFNRLKDRFKESYV